MIVGQKLVPAPSSPQVVLFWLEEIAHRAHKIGECRRNGAGMGRKLSDKQRVLFELAKREGYLTLPGYDPWLHFDLEVEWRAWCDQHLAPFIKVELCEQGAIMEYSLLRFPIATELTNAEIDELSSFTGHTHEAESLACFGNRGRIGFIESSDALQIARRALEFCRAGIKHWRTGATTSRSVRLGDSGSHKRHFVSLAQRI